MLGSIPLSWGSISTGFMLISLCSYAGGSKSYRGSSKKDKELVSESDAKCIGAESSRGGRQAGSALVVAWDRRVRRDSSSLAGFIVIGL